MNHPEPQDSVTGFSLVELSIVLVILGLLVGGIMTGQNLIRAAELRSISTELNQWQTAVNLFKDKYMALPGDMRNARDFWNDEGNCAAVESNSHTVALDGGTCDGNGTGSIADNWDSGKYYESFLFWHHLQMAGLVTGDYTGVSGPGGGEDHVLGINFPASKYSRAGWQVWTFDRTDLATSAWFRLDYGHSLVFAEDTDGGTINNSRAVFTPEEAWNIDTKMDDGHPTQGNVISAQWNNGCTGATSNTDFDVEYQLATTGNVCALSFRNAF